MKSKELSYREAISEIEAILTRIENDELDVDELSEKVQRVSQLLKLCKSKLYKTQEEVEGVLRELDSDL
jgi:exodeoxyribonuclease VII small subunit